MCFNESASLVAFTIGALSTIILFYNKLYNFAIFYISIISMQLVEYFAHKSLSTNNKNMNKMSAYFAYFLLLSQPLLLSYITYDDINNQAQNIVMLLCITFLMFGLYSFYQNYKSNKFSISYLNNACLNKICRLDWKYISLNFYHNIVFGLLYFGITGIISFNRRSHNNSILLILLFLLGLTILYMMFDTNKTNIFRINFFGSLWCFLCVVAGPLVIINRNLAI
tara:strand:- start:96 stop:767 length:672 start_codon:yes stop_codon:yes gene_type:complete